MIYTVTFNPSLDYIVSVEDFAVGKTNRTSSELLFPGGKGINVSLVLGNLGIESTALGFLAGFTGGEIGRMLEKRGIHGRFIYLQEGSSRINLKLKNYDGTEINGMGPHIPERDLATLCEQIGRLRAGDVLVLAGSIPCSIPDSIYSSLLARLDGKGVLSVVDASGDLLTDTLRYHPFLIKPNHHELGEIFHVDLRTRQEAVPYAKKLREMGAVNVLVSMSGQGAILVDGNGEVHESPAPAGEPVNAVGAGDSMTAGFLAGWFMEKDYHRAFLMGIAAGSASAFCENFAGREEIMELYRSLR